MLGESEGRKLGTPSFRLSNYFLIYSSTDHKPNTIASNRQSGSIVILYGLKVERLIPSIGGACRCS